MPFLPFIIMMQLLSLATTFVFWWMGNPPEHIATLTGIFMGYVAVLVSYLIWVVMIKPFVKD